MILLSILPIKSNLSTLIGLIINSFKTFEIAFLYILSTSGFPNAHAYKAI